MEKLPKELKDKIYEYDNTYKKNFDLCLNQINDYRNICYLPRYIEQFEEKPIVWRYKRKDIIL
jgi:hypothetical protein